MKRLTTDIFINKAKKVHDNKYDYSLVEYKNNKTKVKIICKKHGIFEQCPNTHLQGRGCLLCTGHKKFTTEEFIEKAKKIHGDKFDYSLTEYENDKTKVSIICKKHGIFKQTPNVHYNHGCPDCYNDRQRFTTQKFIEKSKKIHGDKFDYSLVEYKNIRTKVKICCKKNGIFYQTPVSNLKGNGCLKCRESKGESEISKFLKKNNIKFIQQKTFKKCKNVRTLPFDFYLPNYNTCIEFDGEQHFKIVEYWGR